MILLDDFLPCGWDKLEHGQRAYAHSKTVANVAKLIASKTSILDCEKAYTYGLMHDVGKFYLKKSEIYKHPIAGYDLMKEKYPDIAIICVTHPFPNFENFEHILRYCHDDKDEADKIFDILCGILRDDYIDLIQFCDKISRMDDYIRFEDKLQWYIDKYNLRQDEIIDQYSDRMSKIKAKFDSMANIDIYELINI